jgi:hypothetical protein
VEVKMKDKDCKIVCDGVEIATIKSKEGEFGITWTEEGKKRCKDLCKGCC